MSLFDQLRRSILGKNEQNPSSDVVSENKTPIQEEKNTERRRKRRVDAKKGTRVLIIDDSPTIVAALRKLLVSAKYTTYEAFDAESGMQIAQEKQPDLIFLDIVLPGMNGFAALRLMRRDPKTQHIPIIMISGNEQATEQFYANRIGADDFMKKPFSRFEVFARIEGLLDTQLVPRRKGAIEQTVESKTTTPTIKPSPAPVRAVPTKPVTTAPLVAPSPPNTIRAQAASVTTPAVLEPAYPSAKPIVQPSVRYTSPVTPSHFNITTAIPLSHAPATSPTPQIAAAIPAQATPSNTSLSPLEARKELTLMGLQYFDQQQFIAAVKRGDKLAFELFVAGGAVDLESETEGKTPLQVARENGRTQIFAILRSKLATP